MAVHTNKDRFLQAHPGQKYQEDMNTILKPLKPLGISYFAHNHIDSDGCLSTFNNAPEWTQLYFDNNHFSKGLHNANIKGKKQYFVWDDLLEHNSIPQVYTDLMSLNKRHMFSIIETSGRSRDCFHFASSQSDVNMNMRFLQNRELLEKFIRYFKDKISSNKKVYNDITSHKFKYGLHHYNYFEEFSHSSDKISDELSSVKRFYLGGEDSAYVTKREYECLLLLAEGKSYADVAANLQTSIRMVKEHVKNIKDRLHCKNLFQLGNVFARLT